MENMENEGTLQDPLIRDRLTGDQWSWFQSFERSLGVTFHFYGSIVRMDYFPGKSDFDIYVVSDQVKTVMQKACLFLSLDRRKVRQIIQKFTDAQVKIVKGYKLKFEKPELAISFDLLFYDETYESLVRDNVESVHRHLPFWMMGFLYLLKWLHYRLDCIPDSLYLDLKNGLFYFYFHPKSIFDWASIQPMWLTTVFLDESFDKNQ